MEQHQHPIRFVSLGPGEPELITVKALKALQDAEVIFYPSAKKQQPETSRAFAIMEALHIDAEKCVPFFVPMVKNREVILQAYRQVAEQLLAMQAQGRKVAIVAEGDAGFYATTYYIYEYIADKGGSCERITGVPAIIAAATRGMLHLASQEQELHVVPGNITAESLQQRVLQNQSVAIMKGSMCEAEVKRCIRNLPTANYHYFENVGLPHLEMYTCNTAEILERTFPYFSIIIVQNQQAKTDE